MCIRDRHLIMHFPEIKEAFYAKCAVLVEGETEYGCIHALSLIHISEPTRRLSISYAVFCLKKKRELYFSLELHLYPVT